MCKTEKFSIRLCDTKTVEKLASKSDPQSIYKQVKKSQSPNNAPVRATKQFTTAVEDVDNHPVIMTTAATRKISFLTCAAIE